MADTQHSAMVHDAQLDFYGKRLATCSSDRSIKIYDLDAGGQRTLSADLRIHNGPVWAVAWAHPRFGRASLSLSIVAPLSAPSNPAPQPSWRRAHMTGVSLYGARRRLASGARLCVACAVSPSLPLAILTLCSTNTRGTPRR